MAVKIADLELNETQKKLLTLCHKPKSAYELAAKLKRSYSSINQNMGVLNALGHVIKIKRLSGGVVYELSKEVSL